MSAWASAGVTIPRDTYEQWAALPHIPVSDIKPGDLLYYNGIGHVAMYVGGGMIIDAPTTGPGRARAPDEHRPGTRTASTAPPVPYAAAARDCLHWQAPCAAR